jgi:hypothetical protein
MVAGEGGLAVRCWLHVQRLLPSFPLSVLGSLD